MTAATSINSKRNAAAEAVEANEIGENVLISEADGKITIVIDLNHRGELSASGKTVRVASTEGNQVVAMSKGKPVTLGLNAYVKP